MAEFMLYMYKILELNFIQVIPKNAEIHIQINL